MISVEEATRIILDHQIDIPDTIVPLEDAIGRVLREDLVADRDFPPYNRVTMDGIAIDYEAFSRGKRTFPIAGVGAAGAPQLTLPEPGVCVEIMTGAILPEKADTVVRYEDVEIRHGEATITIDAVQRGQNIHRQGIDRQRGARIVAAGRRIGSPEIGVAATVGKHQLRVAAFPPAVIVSTGDELVEVHEQPLPYQIRKSNVHRLRATLRRWGIQADSAHIADDQARIRETLAGLLESHRILIMSGGVSKGKFDYLPEALEQLGVRKLFHRIRQRPGKPFWFGVARNGALVFALPGNPVSSFMCTIRYFRPWMEASLGLPPGRPYGPAGRPHGILTREVAFRPDLTYFAQVRLEYDADGRILAHPVEGHGSGDLANLVDADAFIELPRGKDRYAPGERYPLWMYR